MGIYLLPREIGIYNICLKLALMVSLSLTSLNMIFSPTLSGLFARREKKLVEKLYKTTTKWILTISLIAFGILILFSKPILSIFGPAFINGTNILILLVFGDLINSGVGSVGTILLMSGRSKLVLINTIGITIVTGIFCLFLIPRYGMLGAALSRTITVILANIVRLLEVHYYENIHPYKLSFIKPIMAFGISFPVFFFGIRYFEPMSKLEFLLGVFLFLVLFSFLIWLFRLDSEDRYILKLIKNRIFSLKN
ncbi:MAG: polysaccharide biosynthesis C-terminal domain-containing protein, partial [Candidatus Cloacimonetes bacterium]|nr:polysaccharide biosynthesis C-terminal domain-containing protein [Candidatus Cloacimonadota bacterium]